MNIQIKRNSFVEPTLARDRVVQDVCDVIVSTLSEDNDTCIILAKKNPKLFLGTLKEEHPAVKKKILNTTGLHTLYNFVKVRSCEMRMAFRLIQDAGYHIFFRKKENEYVVTMKSYDGTKLIEHMEFEHHID